jgi:hypothetical protein
MIAILNSQIITIIDFILSGVFLGENPIIIVTITNIELAVIIVFVAVSINIRCFLITILPDVLLNITILLDL